MTSESFLNRVIEIDSVLTAGSSSDSTLTTTFTIDGGIVGMYDYISSTFMVNNGSGAFIKGEDIVS